MWGWESISKAVVGAELEQPRTVIGDDRAKGGAVDILVPAVKGSMVERVESVHPNLKGLPLADFDSLERAHVEAENPGAIEQAALQHAQRARAWIEENLPRKRRAAIVIDTSAIGRIDRRGRDHIGAVSCHLKFHNPVQLSHGERGIGGVVVRT